MARSTKQEQRGRFLRAAKIAVRSTADGASPLLDFPFTVPAIRAFAAMERLNFHHQVTFLVGENGSGKSTLLEGLADALRFPEQGGTRNFNRDPGEPFTQLRRYLVLERTGDLPIENYYLRAESFFNLATQIDELMLQPGYGGTSLHQRSHGEGFLALLQYRLEGNGLYLMDEPEAALSVQSQFAALGFIRRLVQTGSQFIIATHSPILLAYPDAWIYRLSEDGLERVAYENTEPYFLTRSFLDNPARMLRQIFE